MKPLLEHGMDPTTAKKLLEEEIIEKSLSNLEIVEKTKSIFKVDRQIPKADRFHHKIYYKKFFKKQL